jgi:hypothetical protein
LLAHSHNGRHFPLASGVFEPNPLLTFILDDLCSVATRAFTLYGTTDDLSRIKKDSVLRNARGHMGRQVNWWRRKRAGRCTSVCSGARHLIG